MRRASGESEHTIDLGNGFFCDYMTPIESKHESLDYDVTLHLAVEGGRLVCVEMNVARRPGGPAVSAQGVARLPVVRLFHAAAFGGPEEGNLWRTHRTNPSGDDQRWNLKDLPELERVAIVYRAAFAFGEAPTKAVAAALGVNDAVAAKRVQAARRAGLLDPTTKGRKGS